jgi:hypothetical protein
MGCERVGARLRKRKYKKKGDGLPDSYSNPFFEISEYLKQI